MEYEIKDMHQIEGGFEVDVEYVLNNEKKQIRFSFGLNAWENEAWKDAVNKRMLEVEKASKLEIDKTKYLGKHTATEPTKELPSHAITPK